MGIPNYQYEPLTPPSSWNADEKRLLQRITDIFDDIYMKWGRLDSNHIAASGVKEKNIAPNAITDSKILSVDAAKVNRLDAVSFEAVTARIQDLAADLITTNGFTAKWAEIASAAISHLRVKYSDTEEAIIRDGIGGEIYIDRLTATSATFISATMGELVVKGDDGKYYEITVRSDGTINTDEVTVSGGEIAAGQTSEGKKIVETEIDVVALNAQNIKATSAIIGSIFTTALTAGKITAGESLIASATIPELRTTAIEAIGQALTISAEGSIGLFVRENSIPRETSLPSDPVVGETIVYTGVQPHEALQWTGKGINPTQRTYAATKTGAAVSFEDLSDRHALGVTVKTVATQAGSGAPSPSNVRAIQPAIAAGGTATVQATGKNLIDNKLVPDTYSGVTLTLNADKSITAVGTASASISRALLGVNMGTDPVIILPPGTYTVPATSGYSVLFRKVGEAENLFDTSVGAKRTVTLTGVTKIGYVILYIPSGAVMNTTIYPQIEVGSNSTAYEPYVGALHSVTSPENAYGLATVPDELKNSGTLTHNTALKTLRASDGFAYYASPNRFWIAVPNMKQRSIGEQVGMCSHAVLGPYAEDGTVHISTQNSYIFVFHPAITSLSAFNDWLEAQNTAGTPVQVLYELATPTTAAVAPVQINGVDGVNVVAGDGTSIAVDYTASGWKRLSNSVIGSNVEITNDHVRIQSDRFSVGNDSAPNNDALVIEDGTVSAPTIESPSVMPAYTGPRAIAIKTTATESEEDAGTAFKTLAAAATALNRKWLPTPVTVTVNATIDEYSDVVFNGIAGSSLSIVGAGTYSDPSDSMPRHRGIFYIQDCTARISIQNMRIANALTAAQTILSLVSGSIYVEYSRCVLEDTGSNGGTILYANRGATVNAGNCAFVNATGVSATACRASYGGKITVSNARGDLSANTVLMDVWSGTIYWSGTAPVCANATVAANTTTGTAAYSLGNRTPFRGSQGGGAASPVSVDLSPILARAHLTEDGWGGALYQGYTPAKGRCTTCYWFDVSALAGKTILSASLKLHRYSGYGRNDGVVVRIHPINNASASGGLSRGDFIAQIGKVSAGATREMELPTSVVEALIAGTYKAIGIYTGETQTMSDRLYSSNYGRWYGDAVLSVTYQ